MSASPRVIRPRAWPDWSLRSACTLDCSLLECGVPGAGREPNATRESARARRRAIKIRIRMKSARRSESFLRMAIKMKLCSFVIFQSVPQTARTPSRSYHPWAARNEASLCATQRGGEGPGRWREREGGESGCGCGVAVGVGRGKEGGGLGYGPAATAGLRVTSHVVPRD